MVILYTILLTITIIYVTQLYIICLLFFMGTYETKQELHKDLIPFRFIKDLFTWSKAKYDKLQ